MNESLILQVALGVLAGKVLFESLVFIFRIVYFFYLDKQLSKEFQQSLDAKKAQEDKPQEPEISAWIDKKLKKPSSH